MAVSADNIEQIGYHECLVDISEDADLSNAVDLADREIIGLITPTGLTTTTLSFEVATTAAGTYQTFHNTSGNITLTVDATSRRYYLNPETFRGVRHVKIRTGTNELTADKLITLMTQPRRG